MNNNLATFLTLAIFSLTGIAASIGHRVYTYVKYVPTDKWLEPALVPATISIAVGIICTAAAFAFVISLYKEGIYCTTMVMPESDAKAKIRDLESKLALTESKNKTLDSRNTDLVNSKSDVEKRLQTQHIKTTKAENDAKQVVKYEAPKPAVYTPPAPAPAPRYTPPPPTTINVKQVNRGGCSGCGWWIFILILCGASSAIFFVATMGPGRW